MMLFSRTRARGAILAGALAAAATAPAALAADDLPAADDLRLPGPPPGEVPLLRPYLPPSYAPPLRYGRATLDTRPVLPPYQVVTILRTTGYAPLGPVTRRGWIYTLAALDPHGDDGRLIIDARTGHVMRFIPAMAVDERLSERLEMIYGPPGPPPPVVTASGYETRRGSLLDLRRAPRPPATVPHAARRPAAKAASRTQSPAAAASTPQPAAPAAPAKPSPTPRMAEDRQPATVGVATASAPSPLKLWPTQAMPEVQPLE